MLRLHSILHWSQAQTWSETSSCHHLSNAQWHPPSQHPYEPGTKRRACLSELEAHRHAPRPGGPNGCLPDRYLRVGGRVHRREPRPSGPNAWPPDHYLGGGRKGPSPRAQAGRSECLAPRSLPGGCEGGPIAARPYMRVQDSFDLIASRCGNLAIRHLVSSRHSAQFSKLGQDREIHRISLMVIPCLPSQIQRAFAIINPFNGIGAGSKAGSYTHKTEPTRDAVPWIGFITGSRRSFGVADHQRESSRRLLRSAAPPLNLLREVRHDSQYAQFLREGF